MLRAPSPPRKASLPDNQLGPDDERPESSFFSSEKLFGRVVSLLCVKITPGNACILGFHLPQIFSLVALVLINKQLNVWYNKTCCYLSASKPSAVITLCNVPALLLKSAWKALCTREGRDPERARCHFCEGSPCTHLKV